MKIIILLKTLLLMVHLILGLFLSIPCYLTRGRIKKNLIVFWSRGILFILNVKISQNLDLDNLLSNQNYLITSNHISWLDILVINSISPLYFVSKDEVKSWPIINIIAIAANTIFINRSSKASIKKINPMIKDYLEKKSVCIFPEGTSSDGRDVLPFKSNLLQSAIDAKCSVLPISIQYFRNQKISTDPAFYADISLIQSLINTIKTKKINVKVYVMHPVSGFTNRKNLAHTLYKMTKDSIKL